MSITTGEIQPVASGPWVAPQPQHKEAQSIPPVTRTEGGTAAKVGDFTANSGPNFPLPPPGFSDEVVQQVQAFLKQNTGLELNFIADADGRTIVQVLDSNTGKLIRQIPPDKVSLFRDKIAKLRGILFDGKA
jgi:flagellar protein FlaG